MSPLDVLVATQIAKGVNADLDRAAFGREWEQWHRAHDERRAAPDGFLAVTGLHWLDEDEVVIPDAPGRWSTGPDGPVVDLGDDEHLVIEGERVVGRFAFGSIPERASVVVQHDGGVVEVARRGGRDIVRPRRADHPFLAAYRGTPTYPPNPRWRVLATFIPSAVPVPTTVGAAVDGLTHVYDAPGVLAFELHGEPFRLTAFPGRHDDELLVLFADATSGITTEATGRSVVVAAPGADGTTVIDFTRAVNPPCAYTDFATCPLPPAGNRLPIGIEAGEKRPLDRIIAA